MKTSRNSLPHSKCAIFDSQSHRECIVRKRHISLQRNGGLRQQVRCRHRHDNTCIPDCKCEKALFRVSVSDAEQHEGRGSYTPCKTKTTSHQEDALPWHKGGSADSDECHQTRERRVTAADKPGSRRAVMVISQRVCSDNWATRVWISIWRETSSA